jgi:hypothetical protein
MAALKQSPHRNKGRSSAMSANVRSIPALWSLRQRRNAVDDPQEYEALRDRLADLETELVVEQDAGLLSEALGRPSSR